MAQSVSHDDLKGVADRIEYFEGQLYDKITATNQSANPTTAELLALQQSMQQWSMLVDLQATLAKTLSETMKSVIQKSG